MVVESPNDFRDILDMDRLERLLEVFGRPVSADVSCFSDSFEATCEAGDVSPTLSEVGTLVGSAVSTFASSLGVCGSLSVREVEDTCIDKILYHKIPLLTRYELIAI